MTPLNDNVIVKLAAAEDMTPGGIVLPKNMMHAVVVGEVMAVGPGVMLDCGTRIPCTVKPGDKVAFQRGHSVEMMLGGETMLAILERQLIAVV